MCFRGKIMFCVVLLKIFSFSISFSISNMLFNYECNTIIKKRRVFLDALKRLKDRKQTE